MAGRLSIQPLQWDVGRTFNVLILILLRRKHLDQLACFFTD